VRSFILTSGLRPLTSLLGHFQHFRAEIEAGRLRAALRERKGKVAGAAAQVERAAAGLHGGEPHDAAFPAGAGRSFAGR